MQRWEVVGGRSQGGIVVREGHELKSSLAGGRLATGSIVDELRRVGDRLNYRLVAGGGPGEGWVSLRVGGQNLLAQVDGSHGGARPDLPGKPKPEALKLDLPKGPPKPPVLVSDLLSQLEAELQGGRHSPDSPPWPPAAPETAGPKGGGELGGPDQHMTISLTEDAEEGSSSSSSAQLPPGAAEWLARSREWLRRLNPKAAVPAAVQLPVSAASTWEPAAAVLFAVTQGQFDPQRDVPGLGARLEDRRAGLVSVLCCTSDGRRAFHPLIYENFRAQTYEDRELVVVHTGEMPSDFFQDMAEADPRVIYRFFPVTREAPGSPRLVDETMKNPMAAVLQDDVPSEVMHWEEGSPFGTEIHIMGWTKGLKRNIACCIANGSVMAHFDDGCLYSPEYLSRMARELPRKAAPAAITLANWYSLGIQEKLFRLVDLSHKDPLWEEFGNPPDALATDKWQHGFSFVYSRDAWEQQPFTDWETVGTGGADFGFMNGLKKKSMSTQLVKLTGGDALAACGWHRDSLHGSVDTSTSINASLVLEFIMYRGHDVGHTPRTFKPVMAALNEVASALYAKRERYLNELVEDHGPVWVCAMCNFALALDSSLTEHAKEYNRRMPEVDAASLTRTYEKVPMKFDVALFRKAGGCLAEGHSNAKDVAGHSWLDNWVERMAICRNCGSQLGWRFEPSQCERQNVPTKTGGAWELVDSDYGFYVKKGQKEVACEVPTGGPLMWGLIGRHLRLRQRPGEYVPSEFEADVSRHKETEHNRGHSTVCPNGHPLRRFPCGQGNGACRPIHYVCDLCDRQAKASWHMWGCGTCDYDVCDECQQRRMGTARLALR
mmetsp:Transcript_5910/g.16810  ORF Transcript_5910/g.16810 Transcript_5910/m.16810 type:complete len:831 (-) Transcript_5910:294-2786(-)